MLQYLRDQDKYVEITGYRSIKFDRLEAFLKADRKQTRQNIDIQFFDANLIATSEHLYFAVLNALQAFKNKTNLSKSPAVEAILYASAQRQIQKAIEFCGIKPEAKSMALIIIGDDPKQIEDALEKVTKIVGSAPDISVLEISKSKATQIKRVFGITDQELKTVDDSDPKKAIASLVIERVALLATQL
ncbi:MAG TPA: KEOPS complex subunit Cgi121 [Candidatus Binatia bacterium]|nr:KEOPS complex subunit Cgi121 [Candidatus Binatia bacterium]